MAQSCLAYSYEYDDSGNRTLRKVIMLYTFLTPPAPTDSLHVTRDDVTSDEFRFTSDDLRFTSDDFRFTSDDLRFTSDGVTGDGVTCDGEQPEPYFVEKVAQVEINIYPNPTTEKVTLEIGNMEKLQTGNFKLFSLTGQLLQEHPVHSSTTTVSLAGLPNGAYILKVHINNRTEDWKIIKN